MDASPNFRSRKVMSSRKVSCSHSLIPRELKASLDSAIADWNAAKAKFERAGRLLERRVISDQEFENEKREYQVSVAKLDQAKKAFEDDNG
jgi:hypothetical protein